MCTFVHGLINIDLDIYIVLHTTCTFVHNVILTWLRTKFCWVISPTDLIVIHYCLLEIRPGFQIHVYTTYLSYTLISLYKCTLICSWVYKSQICQYGSKKWLRILLKEITKFILNSCKVIMRSWRLLIMKSARYNHPPCVSRSVRPRNI